MGKIETGDKDTRASMRINGWDVCQSGRDRRWYIEDGRCRKGPYPTRRIAEQAARLKAGGLEPYPGFDHDGRRI